MIRLRFTVAVLAVLVLVGGGYTWAALAAQGPAWVAATDPVRVAAARHMLDGVPTPAGMILDPYGTRCPGASSFCFTSNTVEPEGAFAAMITTLVARGGHVRSHACGAGGMKHACSAVLDYQGSGIDVAAGLNLPGNTRTSVVLSVAGADGRQQRVAAAPYGSWDSVDPLPAAWTAGTRCATQLPAGCRRFTQSLDASPRVAAPLAQVCAKVQSRMTASYYLINEVHSPASAAGPASCGFVGHRFRSVGAQDGEILSVTVRATDPQHSTLRITMAQDT